MRPGQLLRLSEEPDSYCCKGDTKTGLGLQKTRGPRRKKLALRRGKRNIFRGMWRPPPSALDTCWGVFGFYWRSLLLQGKFSLVACTYLPAC